MFEICVSLEHLWRSVRKVTSYKEDSTSEEEEEDFADGLDFEDPVQHEVADHLVRPWAHDDQVDQVGKALEDLHPEPEVDLARSPREHFSPVRVTFPVHAPALRPPPIMPDNDGGGQDDAIVDFEEEDGRDDDRAMQDACRTLERFEWQPEDATSPVFRARSGVVWLSKNSCGSFRSALQACDV